MAATSSLQVSPRVLFLSRNQRPIKKHIDRSPTVMIQAGSQASKQSMKAVSHLADFFPKKEQIKVINPVDALACNFYRRHPAAVRVEAQLQKLVSSQIPEMGGVYACDLPQLVKQNQRLFIANCPNLLINRSHEN